MTSSRNPESTPDSGSSRFRTPESIEGYVRFLSRYFYAPGLDPEDLAQEARLGVLTAPPGRERLVARRRVIDAVKTWKRSEDWRSSPEFVELDERQASEFDVVEVVATRDRLRRVAAVSLTPVQREAVERVLRGEPYAHDKRLDNALVAARRKFRAAAA